MQGLRTIGSVLFKRFHWFRRKNELAGYMPSSSGSVKREFDSLDHSSLPLIAYRTKPTGLTLKVAAVSRKWMSDTNFQFAARCLPMRMANQAGWFILNDRRIHVTWNGDSGADGLTIQSDNGKVLEDHDTSAVSHFGYGIVTWRIPYLFRTPTGFNLYVRGPANWYKDGACPLDAIVETDWAIATFTMNWKITRIGKPIEFSKDEPICMVFPFFRGNLERFTPLIRDLQNEPEIETKYKQWKESRRAFNQTPRRIGEKWAWQKHYYVGTSPGGENFSGHQTEMALRDFQDKEMD